MFEIWVDEGHGGADSGAVGGGFKEDDRNLALGNEVVRLSKIQGWDVKRTRSTDTFVMLTDRYKKANAATSDVFVGIHHDWTGGRQAVIYPKGADGRASKSMRLADFVNESIDALAPTTSIIYADRRGLAVLNGTNMPAVIIEAARVQDPYNVTGMAEAIVKGICRYFGVPYVITRPTVTRPPAVKVMYVTASALNIRTGPSTRFRVVGRYKKGDTVGVVKNVGSWRKLATGDYVHGAYLSATKPAAPAPKPAAPAPKPKPTGKTARVVNCSFLNVRSSASMKGKVVGVLKAGQKVSVGPTKNGWTQVLSPYKGYAGAKFLKS